MPPLGFERYVPKPPMPWGEMHVQAKSISRSAAWCAYEATIHRYQADVEEGQRLLKTGLRYDTVKARYATNATTPNQRVAAWLSGGTEFTSKLFLQLEELVGETWVPKNDPVVKAVFVTANIVEYPDISPATLSPEDRVRLASNLFETLKLIAEADKAAISHAPDLPAH